MIPNRIVIDTNVCLDLFVFRDPRWSRLASALQSGAVVAVTRTDCRDEWRLVLAYACFALDADSQAAAGAAFDALITCLPAASPSPSQTLTPLPRCSDPDDQKFLEVARDAAATSLITKDKALLKLAGKCRRSGLFSIHKPEAWLATFDPPATF
ncbi:MAG: putative toxin-antitoxin system toxin component, PIN family [Herminiimonas sp.]|nr:putative toxin-antitoxin system toxin component, PIN family [Herminiimonas sp.]